MDVSTHDGYIANNGCVYESSLDDCTANWKYSGATEWLEDEEMVVSCIGNPISNIIA